MRRGFSIFVVVIAACTAGVVGEKEDFDAEPRQVLSKSKGEGGENFDWGYCKGDPLCGEAEGDCDKDDHCEEGLVCRRNVGKHFGVDNRIDVCLPEDWEPSNECALGGCTPTCKADQILCDDKCTNVKKDRKNCGGCGLVCPDDTICGGNGFCQECEADLLVCGNGCVDTETDAKNCGGCGQICPQESVCADGACCKQRACGDDECGMVDDGCGGEMDCGTCQNICEGNCDTAAPGKGCFCDAECVAYKDCCQDADGTKGADRSYAEQVCDACEPKVEVCNLKDDDCDGVLDNGDNLCPEGESCQAGKCKPVCEPKEESCNGVDDNCNGVVDEGDGLCLVGEVCQAGKCVIPCEPKEESCNGVDDNCDGVIDEGALCLEGEACVAGSCQIVKPCTVKVNGVVIKTVQAINRNDCYKQTSFGSANCSTYAQYFVTGSNLLEQFYDGSDKVNSDTCVVP